MTRIPHYLPLPGIVSDDGTSWYGLRLDTGEVLTWHKQGRGHANTRSAKPRVMKPGGDNKVYGLVRSTGFRFNITHRRFVALCLEHYWTEQGEKR